MIPVTNVTTKLASLAALTATGGVLVAAKVHLFNVAFLPNPNMKLADFTEADYVGYVAQTIGTFGAPYIGVDGLAHITAPGLQFQPTDATVPNTIFGAYWTNTGGTVLIAAVAFDQPIPLIDATTGLVYEPDMIYGA